MNLLKGVAMIGLGHQAQSDHLPGLAACQFAQLVAVVDTDETLAAETAGRLGVPGFTDAVTLLEAVAPDFVIVAVPHHAAPGLVEAAAERGVHVLMEKPFATDIATAHHLAEVAGKAGIEVMVSVQRRWNPIYTTAVMLLDVIGPPFLVEARSMMHTADPGTGWRGHRDLAGGGALADMGYHSIDLLMWYLGLPDRVLANTFAAALPFSRGSRPVA